MASDHICCHISIKYSFTLSLFLSISSVSLYLRPVHTQHPPNQIPFSLSLSLSLHQSQLLTPPIKSKSTHSKLIQEKPNYALALHEFNSINFRNLSLNLQLYYDPILLRTCIILPNLINFLRKLMMFGSTCSGWFFDSLDLLSFLKELNELSIKCLFSKLQWSVKTSWLSN